MAAYVVGAFALLGCVVLSLCFVAFTRELKSPHTSTLFPGFNRRFKHSNLGWSARLTPMLAALVCASFAFVVSVAAQKKSDNSTIPLWFLAVVLVVVLRYGALAGVLATTLSGLVFATYLFEPLGTVAIKDADQKNSLMWMLIILYEGEKRANNGHNLGRTDSR